MRTPRALPIVVALLCCLAGCDGTGVDVYSGSERYFSIYGYLDASRSKQVVRVEPLQDSLLVGADSTAIRVTLRDVERGRTVELTEEPLRFPEATLRNYSTRLPIRPGATYRLVAERLRDGATSEAEVTVPEHAPDVRANPNSVIVRGVERLGALVAFYSAPSEKESLLADTTRQSDGSYRVLLAADGLPPPSTLAQVEAASVSADWPDYGGPVGEGPAPPVGAVSNVENGVGYVGGAITRTASP